MSASAGAQERLSGWLWLGCGGTLAVAVPIWALVATVVIQLSPDLANPLHEAGELPLGEGFPIVVAVWIQGLKQATRLLGLALVPVALLWVGARVAGLLRARRERAVEGRWAEAIEDGATLQGVIIETRVQTAQERDHELTGAVVEAEVGTLDDLLPFLMPPEWEPDGVLVHGPLVEAARGRIPWVVHTRGVDGPALRSDELEGGVVEQAIRLVAVRGLSARRRGWTVRAEDLSSGTLGRMQHSEARAAEQILDPDFIAEARTALGCRRVALGVPRRGLLLAASADDERATAEFAAWVDAEHRSGRSEPLTSTVFVWVDGAITAVLEGEPSNRPAVTTMA